MGKSDNGDGAMQIAPQGVGGYHQCWYPVAGSDEVKAGEIIGRDFCDGRIIIFRGENGEAAVLSAYCRHLGADLSAGEVIGNDARCAFHHWKFDATGKCTDIPSGDPIPKSACMFKFPVVERLGLIWAFNGEEPLYDPPAMPIDESELAIRVDGPWPMPMDHWIGFTNSYDFSHLKTVHGIDVLNKPDDIKFEKFGAQYKTRFVDPNLGLMEHDHQIFGTCAFYLYGLVAGVPMAIMAAMAPTPGNTSRGWSIAAVPKDSAESPEKLDMILTMAMKFIGDLLKDDLPIMEGIRFREDQVVATDLPLKRYLDYVRDFPRAHPSQPYIT